MDIVKRTGRLLVRGTARLVGVCVAVDANFSQFQEFDWPLNGNDVFVRRIDELVQKLSLAFRPVLALPVPESTKGDESGHYRSRRSHDFEEVRDHIHELLGRFLHLIVSLKLTLLW
ncbi:hypothetical protein SPHV1_330005 [Novosphingobium sp. KN65.2]|nr:hypothetical protein SPHV1_330005 [Novosphingobium sp. KN65.2]